MERIRTVRGHSRGRNVRDNRRERERGWRRGAHVRRGRLQRRMGRPGRGQQTVFAAPVRRRRRHRRRARRDGRRHLGGDRRRQRYRRRGQQTEDTVPRRPDGYRRQRFRFHLRIAQGRRRSDRRTVQTGGERLHKNLCGESNRAERDGQRRRRLVRERKQHAGIHRHRGVGLFGD